MLLKLKIYFFFVMPFFWSCQNKKQFDSISLGYDNLKYIKEFSSRERIEIPSPPPPKENILPFTFFEYDEKVYFYQLKIRPRLCGSIGFESNFEIYSEDLNLLKKKDILLVNDANLDSLIKNSILLQEPVNRCLAIGIPDSISKNKIILEILNRLNEHPNTISWKVRRNLKEEIALLVAF